MLYFLIIILFILLHILIYRLFKINFLNNYFFFFTISLSLFFFFYYKLDEKNILFLLNFIFFIIFYRLMLLGVFNVSPSIFIIYHSLKIKSIKKLKFIFCKQNFTKKRFEINLCSKLIKTRKKKYKLTNKSRIILFFYNILNRLFSINL